MTQIIDGNGSIHDGGNGRFTGHVQVEGDTGQLLSFGVDPRVAGVFEPFTHGDVEFGEFEVNDRFYAEVAGSSFEGSTEPTVAFYDKRYPMNGKRGQFISRYYISTLREPDDRGSNPHGLNMHGGVPEWTIDAEDYQPVLAELARRAPTHDGLDHQLNPDAWDQIPDRHREELIADLTSRPFGDDERTLAELIRETGAKSVTPGWDGPQAELLLGDGRRCECTPATRFALSKYLRLARPKEWAAA